MATNYPAAADDNTSLPDPTSTSYTDNPDHAGLHANENAAIKALEAKVGTGASTPSVANRVLVSSGGGASSWQSIAAATGAGTASPLTTKGDLWGFSTIDARLPVGSNTQILTADSTQPLGVKWSAAPNSAVWGGITGTLSSQTDLATALAGKVATSVTVNGHALSSNVTVTATDLSLGNVNNTSDANKPVSTAQQTALNLKADLASPTFTGTPSAPTAAASNNSTQLATTAYVDRLGTTSIVSNETPGGLINGINTAYTTASTYATGSLQVYLNGQRLTAGSGVDYVEVTQGFTMQYAPATGDVLLVGYNVTNTTFIQGSNSIIVQETPTGLVNGSNTSFTTLQAKYVSSSLEVFVNGLQQTKTTDYVETTPASGIFTFVTAPLTGDAVRVSYQFSTGASGNADTVDGIHASAAATANQLLALDSGGKFSTTVLKNDYKFLAYRNSALSQAPGIIPMDTKVFDTGTNYSTATGKFTAPVAGFYQFNGSLSVVGGSGITQNIALAVNSTTQTHVGSGIVGTGTVNYFFSVNYLLQLSAADTVGLALGSSFAGSQTVNVGSAPILTSFSGFLVSAT